MINLGAFVVIVSVKINTTCLILNFSVHNLMSHISPRLGTGMLYNIVLGCQKSAACFPEKGRNISKKRRTRRITLPTISPLSLVICGENKKRLENIREIKWEIFSRKSFIFDLRTLDSVFVSTSSTLSYRHWRFCSYR